MENARTNKARIVLVHGAFADGSGWQHIIPPLEEDGYFVIVVQNPLSPLAAGVCDSGFKAVPRPKAAEQLIRLLR